MNMDWTKVALPEFDSTKIQINKIGSLDYAKLLVIAELIAKSQSQIGQTALYTYLKRTWDDHEQRLAVEAARRGISVEECFVAIVEEALSSR